MKNSIRAKLAMIALVIAMSGKLSAQNVDAKKLQSNEKEVAKMGFVITDREKPISVKVKRGNSTINETFNLRSVLNQNTGKFYAEDVFNLKVISVTKGKPAKGGAAATDDKFVMTFETAVFEKNNDGTTSVTIIFHHVVATRDVIESHTVRVFDKNGNMIINRKLEKNEYFLPSDIIKQGQPSACYVPSPAEFLMATRSRRTA